MAISQDNRAVKVSGLAAYADELHFYHLTAHESMGKLFEFQLDLLSENDEVDFSDLLGTTATIEIPVEQDGIRYLNGLISRCMHLGSHGTLSRYRLTLVPWLWFLTRSADCRIFQNKSAVEIIEEVFNDIHGFTDFRKSLVNTYRKRTYCVQYRETAFNFVSRLMEEEGIYYFFEHENGKHTLVLCDATNSHQNFPSYSEVPYFPPDNEQVRERDHISEWSVLYQVQPGGYKLNDFDFEKPRADISANSIDQQSHSHADFEYFDYPGGYFESSDGQDQAKKRLQELSANYARARGSGNARGLACGSTFDLTDFPNEDRNRGYVVVSTTYRVQDNEYQPGVEGNSTSIRCSFEVMDSDQQFRSPRVTPQPVVQGPQTAIVVGKQGEEIWVDEYGRVKVQFHWDRYGESNEDSSCWVRVAQNWAGNAWGSIHIPRIGQEVVVEFLEGDPDRPLITGRVYNADQMPPYALPDNQTQSGLKSRSTKQGNDQNFNELRFEDKKDEEEIYLHAERDFTRVVENNDSLKVGFEKKDPGDQAIEIYNDRKLTVGAGSKQGNQSITIHKNLTETISTGDAKYDIKQGKRTTTIEGDDALTIKTGNQTIEISAGKNVTEAAQSIELKVGGSSIKIEPAAITLKSVQVNIEGEASVDVASPVTTCDGSGSLTLKGGIVNIN